MVENWRLVIKNGSGYTVCENQDRDFQTNPQYILLDNKQFNNHSMEGRPDDIQSREAQRTRATIPPRGLGLDQSYPAIPYPSSPAECCKDTAYPWSALTEPLPILEATPRDV